MKLKTLFICIVLAFTSAAFATNARHTHKLTAANKAQSSDQQKMMMPGYCEIELINGSYESVYVTGRFIDGEWLEPFIIPPYDYPNYISLQYFGICQPGMQLIISRYNGFTIYNRYTPVYNVVSIYPIYGQKQPAVKMQSMGR